MIQFYFHLNLFMTLDQKLNLNLYNISKTKLITKLQMIQDNSINLLSLNMIISHPQIPSFFNIKKCNSVYFLNLIPFRYHKILCKDPNLNYKKIF